MVYQKIQLVIKNNRDEINKLKKVNSLLGILWAIFTLGVTILLLGLFSSMLNKNIELFVILYPLIAIIIAGRQGSFLQIVHEGAHSLIHSNKKFNDLIGNFVGGFIGVSMDDYRFTHGNHHMNTNTKNDDPNDLEKYSVTNVKNRKLWFLFLRDIFGISALIRIKGMFIKKNKSITTQRNNYLTLILCQILIFLSLSMSVVDYLLIWIIPLFTANMFLMRIRGIAEHGLPSQLQLSIIKGNNGSLLTRTLNPDPSNPNIVVKVLELISMGSLSINYHLEHHLIPNVPHYNLKKLHKLMKLYEIADLRINYQSGYFSSLWVSR